MTVDKSQALLKVIDRIPTFAGLGQDSAKLILGLCEFRSAEIGQTLCHAGGQSDEMFVLLSGQLAVVNGDQVQLAVISPVAPVGEMGLITGQPRSATVRTTARANLLVIRKAGFDRLMRSNGVICTQVFRNVIQTMARRLGDSRQAQRRLHDECDQLAESLRSLQEQRDGAG